MKPPITPKPPVVKVKADNASGFMLVLMVTFLGVACLWVFLSDIGGEPLPQTVAAEEPAPAATAAAKPSPAPAEAAPAPAPEPELQPVAAAVAREAPPIAPIITENDPFPGAELTPAAPADPFANEEPLVLTRIESTSTAARQRDAELLAKAAATGHWADYQKFLRRSLDQVIDRDLDAIRRNGFDALWQEAAFTTALMRWRTLESMPLAAIATNDRDAGPLVAWMLGQNETMMEWLLTVGPEDDLPRVLDLLFNAWYGDVELGAKYFNLALACAVVFDREVRVQHPPRSAGYEGRVVINPHERFLWYVDKNENNKLATPIDRMSARDLVWVVCAPVATEELEWAVANMRLRRARWGEAYGMIEYLMERAVNGLNPYEEYTFAEIKKHGGVCGDQSYFCANTARANGIPAMILSGETDLGPHAWVALKTKPDEWSTMTGRIGGVANGQAHNPQTGGNISEQEVWLWNERVYQNPRDSAALWRHMWLADLFEKSERDEALVESILRRANTLGRHVPETWARLHDLMAKRTRAAEDPAAREIVDMWMDFVARMRAQFSDNPRMGTLAGRAEDEFIFPHIAENDARRILARERRRLERSAGEQKDLVVASLKREADLIAASGDEDALVRISRLYSSGLRSHGASVTGFKMMAEDYFDFVKDHPDHAPRAVRDIELAFNRVIETGSRDWFRANTETSIYKMICGYYRHIGDETRATALERRYERLLRRAERGALR